MKYIYDVACILILRTNAQLRNYFKLYFPDAFILDINQKIYNKWDIIGFMIAIAPFCFIRLRLCLFTCICVNLLVVSVLSVSSIFNITRLNICITDTNKFTLYWKDSVVYFFYSCLDWKLEIVEGTKAYFTSITKKRHYL